MVRRRERIVPLLLAAALLSITVGAARAQETATDYAWRPLLEEGGVSFTYIYYAKPGMVADGVVVKLANLNDFPVRYRFQMVFRTEGAEHVASVAGTLGPREVRTGDEEGLYWIPFEDGRPIIEIGMRAYAVERLRPSARLPQRQR